MVLSQFCTFTVWSATSITSPSAPNWGISIQSPTRTMSLLVIWTLATSDRIVSRKINRITAVMAPMPERKMSGERSRRVARMSTVAMIDTTIFTTCT